VLAAFLAQTPPPAPSLNTGANAATVFYVTLLIIFLTAIVTTVATKWARDKCLKYFHGFHVTLERSARPDHLGTGQDLRDRRRDCLRPSVHRRARIEENQLHAVRPGLRAAIARALSLSPRARRSAAETARCADSIDVQSGPAQADVAKRAQLRQHAARCVQRGDRRGRVAVPARQSIQRGAFTQGGNVTQIGQTLLGKFAGNAYEPLLEQYIGRPVIVDCVDPINPNNAIVEYTGYLVDYSAQFLAVFNVKHSKGETVTVQLPDVEQGAPLPPLPSPPPPGVPLPPLPPPERIEHEIAVRIDGLRLKVQNTRHDPVIVLRLERDGYEPVEFGNVIPPMATFDLPARDARGGRLIVECVRMMDFVIRASSQRSATGANWSSGAGSSMSCTCGNSRWCRRC
jgi:hypothetical protein